MIMTAFVWILTYAVHSTALILFVWGLLALFPKVPLRLQESLWRVALLGGIVTATVTQVADVEPLGGHLAVPAAGEALGHGAVSTSTLAPAPAPAPVVRRKITQHEAGDVRITTVQESKPHAIAPAVVTSPAKPSNWPWVVVGLAALGALAALVRLGLGARRAQAQLRGRRDVIEDPILEKFFEMCDVAGLKKDGKSRVRLTASAHLRSPVALIRREVVVPERAIETLSAAQQHGMIAHEIAHLQRRDPQWALVTALFEAVFVFQPLNHLARRKLQELAEFQCDDWAAKATGGGTHLAKCLAEVASWLDEARPTALTVAMADRDSPVVRRITRLLHGRRKTGTGAVSPVLRVGAGTMMLGSAVLLAPNVSPASEGQGTPDLQQPAAVGALSTVTVHERGGESGMQRSAVTIERDDERVQVHVDRTPTAKVIPEPPRRRDRISVRGFYGDSFPFGGGCGSVDIEVDLEDFEADLEGTLDLGFPFSGGCERRQAETREPSRRRHRRERRAHHERRHRERPAEPGVFEL